MIRVMAHTLRLLGLLALLLAAFPAQFRHFHHDEHHATEAIHLLPGAESVQEDCDLCDVPVLADRLTAFHIPPFHLGSWPLQPVALHAYCTAEANPSFRGRAPPALS
jgi:hypothetical protein